MGQTFPLVLNLKGLEKQGQELRVAVCELD